MRIIHQLRLAESLLARLVWKAREFSRPSSGRGLVHETAYHREVKALLYRLLTGNLVGYFLSVTIVSIFLGLGLLIKNYKLITSFDLLRTLTFSYEKILPLFSQVIFGLLAISLLLTGSLCIYSIIQRYLFNPHTNTASKLYRMLITFLLGYFLLSLGRVFRGLWHEPLLYVSLRLSELLTFTYEKLSAFSYDTSLGVLVLIILAFFVTLRRLFNPPSSHHRHKTSPSVTGLMPVLVSVIQVIAIVGIILVVNTLILGVLLAVTINKTMLFYYLILMLGLGMAYLVQECFILKNWQRPLNWGIKLALGGMYLFICLALEGTTIKLLQLFS
jgi:hypothetical protein